MYYRNRICRKYQKRQFKQRLCADINETNNYLLTEMIKHKKKTMIYADLNSSLVSGQAPECGGIKLVNWISTLPLFC